MQLVGRSCDACGKTLKRVDEADGCGACDVAFCHACLDGTDRCPSCQAHFAETREARAAPRARVEAKGKRQLASVAFTLLGSMLLVHLLADTPLFAVVLQVAVVGLLLLWTSSGRRWARWLLVVLTAIAAIANGASALSAPGAAWMLSAALGALYGWCAFVLAMSPSISAHMAAQRAR